MSALHALRGRIGSAAPVNKTTDAAVADPRARKEWLNEQLEERTRQRLKSEEENRLEVDAVRQRLWSPYVRQVARTHELNVAWKQSLDFFSWDRVLSLEDLEALRITGHALGTLPTALAHSLTALTVLSLIATSLESLPENIGDLQLLVTIDLTKNNLRRLPDSITTLPCLTSLDVSSNALEALPTNFGALVLLDKLALEHNRLTTLPNSIGRSRARSANVNANQLTALPITISEMANLTALSVNMNKLTALPDTLALLPKLERLHASQNQITELPHNIGALTTLRDLRLDWNGVTQLPFSFRQLTGLTTLRLENNPLRLPPLDVVVQGVPATIAFIERSLETFVRNARRAIVERLQEILHFAATLVTAAATSEPVTISDADGTSTSSATLPQQRNDDLDIVLALFEPNCERVVSTTSTNTDTPLAFFAVVWDEFYSTLLPALERKRAAQSNDKSESFGFDAFARTDVDDALAHYTDDFGAASMRDRASFRKCCCIDTTASQQHGVRKRKVCIPGVAPYRCNRDALLVRTQMMTHEQAKDQLASTYLQHKVARLVAKTKRKCVAYINSPAGVEHFEALAHTLATSLRQKRVRLAKLQRQHAKTAQAFDTKRHKLQVRIAAFEHARDARLADVRAKLAALTTEKGRLECDGSDAKRVEKVAAKIAKLTAALAQEPTEDKKILELAIALEAVDNAARTAAAAAETAKAVMMKSDNAIHGDDDSNDSSSDSDENESEPNEGDDDGDDDDSSGSGANTDADESSDTDTDGHENDDQSSPDASATAPPDNSSSTKFFQIDMPALAFVDYRRAATRAIERVLDDDNRIANVEELVALYQTHLRDAFVADKCERVAQRATVEFLQMRAVLQRWMGHSHRAMFHAWRDVMRANRLDAALVRERRAQRQRVAEQNRMLEEELARREARKWVARTDMYTDAVYYEHTETHATSWDAPPFWADERTAVAKHEVPALKLPPI